MSGAAIAAEAFANAWLYAAVLLAVGVCATRWWLWFGVRSTLSAAIVEQLERRLAGLVSRVAWVVVFAFLFRAWTHTFATFGWTAAFSWDRLQLIAWRSLWGQGWKIQIAAALAFAVAAFWVQHARRSGWPAAAAACIALCSALPLMGHAAGSPGRVFLHGAHIFGSGLWLGTLAILLIVSRSMIGSDGSRLTMAAVAPAFLARFSPIAISGVATLAAAGGATAYLYLTSLSDFWTTNYGRVLAAKILLFVGVGVCGWINWRRFGGEAAVDLEAAHEPMHFLPVVIEVGLAVAVVLLTSVLTELEHPGP